MILVDAGVIIDYLRAVDPRLGPLFRSLPVAICGVTRAEILHGARSQADRQHFVILLDAFQQVLIPDPLWNTVGDHLATLRGSGLTIPFPDAVVATVALANDVEL